MIHRDDRPNLDMLRSLAVLAVIIDHLVPTLLGSLVFLPLTLAISILSYHLIEEPLIGFGRKI